MGIRAWVRRGVMAAVAVCACMAAGCTTDVIGDPVQVPTSAGATPPLTHVPTLSESVDPCTLLPPSVVQQFGLVPKGPDTLVVSRGCTWRKSSNMDTAAMVVYTVAIGIWDHKGFNDLNPRLVITHYPVGSHDGLQVADPFSAANPNGSGGCGIYLEITPTSLIDVDVTGMGNTDMMCPLADQYVKFVEPRLPPEHR